MLIDTHCHLNDPKAFPDPGATIAEARAVGVAHIVAIGIDDDSSDYAVELADRYPEVFATVGWHPNYTARYEGLGRVEKLLSHPKVVGLGEMGLDFHWDFATREQQERAFRDQLALAEATGLPIVLHCREAYPAVLDILESTPHGTGGMVLHCFAGSADDARRGLALGAFLGVDGPVSYKKADELRSILRALPLDRLVVETDAPYLSPTPYRGKPNRPAWVREVNAALAEAVGLAVDEMAAHTTANARRLFPRLSGC